MSIIILTKLTPAVKPKIPEVNFHYMCIVVCKMLCYKKDGPRKIHSLQKWQSELSSAAVLYAELGLLSFTRVGKTLMSAVCNF